MLLKKNLALDRKCKRRMVGGQKSKNLSTQFVNDPQVNQTQNVLGERQGKINSNIDEVTIEKIRISLATPIIVQNKEGRFKVWYKSSIKGYCQLVGFSSICGTRH